MGGLNWEKNKFNRTMYKNRRFEAQHKAEGYRWAKIIDQEEAKQDGYDFRQLMIINSLHINDNNELDISTDFLEMEIKAHYRHKKSGARKIANQIKEKIISRHPDYQFVWDYIESKSTNIEPKEQEVFDSFDIGVKSDIDIDDEEQEAFNTRHKGDIMGSTYIKRKNVIEKLKSYQLRILKGEQLVNICGYSEKTLIGDTFLRDGFLTLYKKGDIQKDNLYIVNEITPELESKFINTSITTEEEALALIESEKKYKKYDDIKTLIQIGIDQLEGNPEYERDPIVCATGYETIEMLDKMMINILGE